MRRTAACPVLRWIVCSILLCALDSAVHAEQPDHEAPLYEACSYLHLSPPIIIHPGNGSELRMSDEALVFQDGDDSKELNFQSMTIRPAPTTQPGVPFGLPANRATVKRGSATITFAREYAGQFVVLAEDWPSEQSETFLSDIGAGMYCGVAMSALNTAERARLKPFIEYILWSDLALGRVSDLHDVLARRELLKIFLTADEIDDWVEVYCYRVTEEASEDAVLRKIDPVKTWSFAWAPVGKALDDKAYEPFTDLSSFQSEDELTFTLLATEPIDDRKPNRFGFYAQRLKSLHISSLRTRTSLDWTWHQHERIFHAHFDLVPANPKPSQPQSRFPDDMNNGAVVLDGTLNPREVRKILAAYRRYFQGIGFRFDDPVRSTHLERVLAEEMSRTDAPLNFLVREGHADGDDDHLMALPPSGWVFKGHAPGTSRSVVILYDLPLRKRKRPPKYDRVSYSDVSDWLRERSESTSARLFYINASCWGLQKAYQSTAYLGDLGWSEIPSTSPANFFDESGTMRALMDGMLKGRDFADIRKDLVKFRDYAAGYSDTYLLPDQFPHLALVQVRRKLSVEGPEGPLPYIPNGYF